MREMSSNEAKSFMKFLKKRIDNLSKKLEEEKENL